MAESTSGPMALMGHCLHFCAAVIICILVLVGVYLDVLGIVDSNESGSLFNESTSTPKAQRIQENRTAH